MRLSAFGPFAGRELVFAGEGIPAGTLHVVYGPNEAGKSTALRAVSGLLFGISPQTTDAHAYPMTELRVGAVLEAMDGTVVEVVRRKGKKNTLLDPAGNVLDESLLRRLYGGATEATFRALFGLDHVSLREGAEALLAGQGDVGESLFEAALGGGRGIHRVLQELQAEADALFTPKAHKRKLNDAIHAYQESRNNLRMKTRSGEGWLAQKRGLEEAKTEHAALADRLRGRKRELHRLERARRLLPLVARRARILESIAALGAVKLLSPDAAKARETAWRARQQQEAELARLDEDIAAVAARGAALSVPAWLDDPMVARLDDLQDWLGAHRKAGQDRPRLLGTLAAHQADAAALAAALCGAAGGPGRDAAGATLGVADRARVLGLSKTEAALAQRLVQTKRTRDELARRHRARVEELEALPPAADSAPLRRVLRRVERDGDIETRLRAVVEEREALTTELARRTATLGLWAKAGATLAWDATMAATVVEMARPLSAEQVIALPVPPSESVDRFALESQALSAREDRLADDLATCQRRARAVDQKLAALARAGQVPSVDALVGARNARAEAWARLRGALDESVARQKQQSLPLPLPLPLPRAGVDRSSWDAHALDFEGAIARADDAADRLLREADRVAAAAALTAERAEVSRLIADGEVQRTDLGRRRAAVALGWGALWAAVGVQPRGADDMRGWLRRFAEACDIARRLEKATADASKMGEQIRRARAEISSALRDAVVVDAAQDLGALCEQAAGVAHAREDVASRRAALTRELAEIAEDQTRAADEHAEAGAAMEQWRTQWAQAITPLGLPPGASTVEAEAVLELAASLARKQDEVGDIKRRLQSIDRDARQFEEAVRSLAAALTPDLAARPVEEAAEVILQRHRDGVPARQARIEIEADLRRKQHARRAASVAHAAAEIELGALMHAAGVGDLTALEQAERRSTALLDLTRLLRESDDQILALSDGLDLDAAMQDFVGATAEDLDERAERLRDEIDGLDRETQAADRLIGSLEAGLRVWDDSGAAGDGAVDASEEAQGHLARIRELTADYARLRLAARLLCGEIERYREQHQGPVLSRASALLARLTLNRYVSLRADFDETDRPVLRCLRADGTKVSIEGLSDGTRDQLYLALRLATLELQAASAEPLPLILDDILIHFDDDRAGAALGVLAEHARGTQVVLFTHHARIVDLAQKIIPAQSLRVSRLQDSSGQ